MPFSILKPKPQTTPEPIIVVSGLPRSGTSMMMRMLQTAGIDVLSDSIRTADESNPKGYFELEQVKSLKKGEHTFLAAAQGRAIKVISALLEHLPDAYQYRVIFMQRDINEVLASQREMLLRRGEPTDRVTDEELARLYAAHLEKTHAWLRAQANFETLYVDYNQVVREPREALKPVPPFLGGRVALEHLLQVVEPGLYRQRRES